MKSLTGLGYTGNRYYPFGLTMAGISSRAAGTVINKIRFNSYEQQNNEFNDGSGLEWYDYKNRFYDNQVGRFFCVDRLADQFFYYTPYQFAGNEVPNAIDLDGLEPVRFLWNHMFGSRSSEPPKKLTPEEKKEQDQAREIAMDKAISNLKEATNLMILASTAFEMPASEGESISILKTEIKTETKSVAPILKSETEVVKRAMSNDELVATQSSNLIRGGREGTHYVSNAIGNDAKKVTQRLALDKIPDVKVTMEVPKGVFSKPTKIQPTATMPGGGMERTASGDVPVKIVSIKKFNPL